MIIARLIGGLGNQLFQYATGKSLALKNNTILKLDLRHFDGVDPEYRKYALAPFNIEENFASQKEIKAIEASGINKLLEKFKPYYRHSVVSYQGYDFDRNILALGDNVILDGYWQSEKYFKDIADTIKKEYILNKGLSDKAKGIEEKIKRSNSISLHIRRGDYLNDKFSKIYTEITTNFYNKAIYLINKEVANPVFFIFSDDAEWVNEHFNLAYDKFIVSGQGIPDYEELMLMSVCKHNIIANSTFSWWGAWLNSNPQKTVIAPVNWLKVDNYKIDDLVPGEWVKL